MYYPILLLIYHCSDNRANEGFRGRQNMYYPNILEMHYPSTMHPFVKKLISRKFTAIGESQVNRGKYQKISFFFGSFPQKNEPCQIENVEVQPVVV